MSYRAMDVFEVDVFKISILVVNLLKLLIDGSKLSILVVKIW